MKIKFSSGVIHVGSCPDVLPTLPDNSVHCAITSPPYFALRDYGTGSWEGGDPECGHVELDIDENHQSFRKSTLGVGNYKNPAKNPAFRSKMKQFKGKCKKCGAVRKDAQLGQESTPEEYIANMVKVFREVRRVLRNDGTLFLNLGDTFKDGQLLGIPWRTALALQADGWWLRMDNIWFAQNKMPESCTNRCSRAHEYMFLLAKRRQYYYDYVAIMDRAKYPGDHGFLRGPIEGCDDKHISYRAKSQQTRKLAGVDSKTAGADVANKRSVWVIPTKSFKGSHFAVFPDNLVKPCLLAGTSEKGCCARCGAPYRRVVKKVRNATRPGTDTKVKGTDQATHGNRDPRRHVTRIITKGWRPTCECGVKEIKPCVALDPFSGAGTVGKVAVSKNRHFIGIELNPKYAELSRKRINKAIMNRGFGL